MSRHRCLLFHIFRYGLDHILLLLESLSSLPGVWRLIVEGSYQDFPAGYS